MWRGGDNGEPELLASCYQRSLEIAVAHSIKTVAFPCISTGIFGYPIELAAQIAVATVRSSVQKQSDFEEIVFCCFQRGDLEIYETILKAG